MRAFVAGWLCALALAIGCSNSEQNAGGKASESSANSDADRVSESV
jgi:hypothetical protein